MELKKSYIIFICTFDPFGLDRYVYTFENRCLEDERPCLRDEAIKMFVNTKGHIGDVNDDFRELMHFLDTSERKEYQNPLVNDLSDALEKARSMEEWRHQYMTMEMLRMDSREDGRAEGRIEGQLSLLFKLLRSGTLTIEQAAANNETSIPELLDQLRNAGYDIEMKENGVAFGTEG